MRVILAVLYVVIGVVCRAQHNKNAFNAAVSMPLSFTDAPTAVGYGINGGWHFTTKSNLGFGAELDLAVFRGGNESLNDGKGYCFKTHQATLTPYVDYTIGLFARKKIELIPAIGGGVMGYDVKGGFYNSEAGLEIYRNWGRPYFVPTFNSEGEAVDATTQGSGVAFALMPTMAIAYRVDHHTKIYVKTGYQFLNSDDIDGFNLPTVGNQGKDIIQVNYVGVSYLLYRRKILKLF